MPYRRFPVTYHAGPFPRQGTSTIPSLRSIHNLHTVYEKFTGLECVPVRLEARGYAGNTRTTSRAGHEEHGPPYVPVHACSLARYIDHSSDSDIANEARTRYRPSSSDADGAALQRVDHIRPKHGCACLPPLQIFLRSHHRLELCHSYTTKGSPVITVDRFMTRQIIVTRCARWSGPSNHPIFGIMSLHVHHRPNRGPMNSPTVITA